MVPRRAMRLCVCGGFGTMGTAAVSSWCMAGDSRPGGGNSNAAVGSLPRPPRCLTHPIEGRRVAPSRRQQLLPNRKDRGVLCFTACTSCLGTAAARRRRGPHSQPKGGPRAPAPAACFPPPPSSFSSAPMRHALSSSEVPGGDHGATIRLRHCLQAPMRSRSMPWTPRFGAAPRPLWAGRLPPPSVLPAWPPCPGLIYS